MVLNDDRPLKIINTFENKSIGSDLPTVNIKKEIVKKNREAESVS